MRCFPGWQAGIFTGDPPLGRELGLRAYRVAHFYNGADRVPLAAVRAR